MNKQVYMALLITVSIYVYMYKYIHMYTYVYIKLVFLMILHYTCTTQTTCTPISSTPLYPEYSGDLQFIPGGRPGSWCDLPAGTEG